MKRGMLQIILAAMIVGLIAAPLFAERNLVPNMQNAPDVCPDRPPEPDWMQNISLQDAFQRVLVQDIYRAQNIERIVATGSCSCAVRFPAWDAAEAAFQESHASADRWEMLQASDRYNRRANALRLEAKAICKAAGNW